MSFCMSAGTTPTSFQQANDYFDFDLLLYLSAWSLFRLFRWSCFQWHCIFHFYLLTMSNYQSSIKLSHYLAELNELWCLFVENLKIPNRHNSGEEHQFTRSFREINWTNVLLAEIEVLQNAIARFLDWHLSSVILLSCWVIATNFCFFFNLQKLGGDR